MGNIQLDSEQIAKSWEGRFSFRIYNRLLLNILYVINQKYGLNL